MWKWSGCFWGGLRFLSLLSFSLRFTLVACQNVEGRVRGEVVGSLRLDYIFASNRGFTAYTIKGYAGLAP